MPPNMTLRPLTSVFAAALLLLTHTSNATETTAAETASDAAPPNATDTGWAELFNGRDLTGWRATEHPESFRVEDGLIVANGERSHLFYVGEVGGGVFKDFELEVEVMLLPGSNSGVFFHTKVQESGWPQRGYEAQLNNTQRDRIKTGSLYKTADLLDDSPAVDNEWFTMRVAVEGKRVRVFVNGKLVNDYTEADDYQPPIDRPGRRIGTGTIALQGHDPDSTVRFRRVRIKPLPLPEN